VRRRRYSSLGNQFSCAAGGLLVRDRDKSRWVLRLVLAPQHSDGVHGLSAPVIERADENERLGANSMMRTPIRSRAGATPDRDIRRWSKNPMPKSTSLHHTTENVAIGWKTDWSELPKQTQHRRNVREASGRRNRSLQQSP